MPDFSPWLNALDASDPDVTIVRTFANALPVGTWPAASNNLAAYVAVIPAGAAQRDALLMALARLYERWFEQERGQPKGFWGFIATRLATIALVLTGFVIAVVLVIGIFVSDTFLGMMAQPDHARGLITFLFSFATIAVIVLVAIAVFWMPPSEVETRFRSAKDVITILVGVLGTVLGFYFGTTSNTAPLSISAVTVPPNPVVAGGKATVTAKVAGGAAPYHCSISVTNGSPAIDLSKNRCQALDTGNVSAEVTIPGGVSSKTDVAFKIVVNDARGGQAESTEARFSVVPVAVSAVTVAPNPVNGGGILTVTAKVSGGVGPYLYDITFGGASAGFDTSQMERKAKTSTNGNISEQISIPAAVPSKQDLTVKVVAKDANGLQAEPIEARLAVLPK